MKITFKLLFVAVLVISLCGCNTNAKESDIALNDKSNAAKDYQKIIENGKLVVLAENSFASYYIYRGQKMGFEYELLREFAKELGVELVVKMVANLDDMIPMLNNHQGDIIACNYTITRERKKVIHFSIPYIQSRQVLIQKKPKNWQKMSSDELDKHIINEPVELGKKHINIWENSSYYERLMHLQDEIGDTIYVDPVNGLIGAEELIEQVSQGIIDYTVVEENIAQVNQRFFNNIDISTPISIKQNIAFGLRKSSKLLTAKLDKWLETFKHSGKYHYIYKKYFKVGLPSMHPDHQFSSVGKGKISPYDELFKKAASKRGLDWQLLASISYQESRFNPLAVGFAGGYGMMQFFPNTGPHYGVYPDSPPAVQIEGGAKKVAADLKAWKKIPDMDQRIKFALASYNAGRGHVQDAQRLAKKYGLDIYKWDDHVEKMMFNLSKQEYYRDEVVKYGAMRGSMTCNYVEEVFHRYTQWKNTFK